MRFKRLIATALAAAMILGLVSVGFAASFEDTEGFEFEASVLKLADLGIISGYPDGTFKPDNLVTRAEFAKMIVCMLGLESAAKSLEGEAVPFADVDADHWAAGYINVAQMMGIVNGYEDGTFRPEGNITYAEALKMVLAAMGYSEDGFLVVRWPATWIAKAIELELDKDLTIVSGLAITRGEVAKLFDNSLTKKHVVVKDGEFVERDPAVTFMSKLKVSYFEGQVIDSPERWDNDDDKVTVKKGNDEAKFAIDDYEGLLGHNVRVWYKGSKVLGVEVLSTEKLLSKTEYDKIKFAEAALFVKNYAVVDRKPAVGTVYDIAVVYDGSTPIAAKVADYTVGRITGIYDYRSIIYVDGDRLDLRGVEVDFRGEADDFEDLKEGDTVHYIYDAQNEKAIIIVLRETFKGRLTEVNTTGSTIKVGGETFSVLPEARDTAKANVGALVTLYLDQNGKVFAIEVDKKYEEQTVTYGIVVATAKRLVDGKRTDFVTVLTVDGEEVEYEDTAKQGFELGKNADVVSITEDSGGTITITKMTTPDEEGLPVTKVDTTAKKLNNNYEYTDNTLWLEWIEDDRVWVVRPRPAVGDLVDLYIEEGKIVVGLVSEPIEGELVPATDYPGYDSWEGAITKDGIDFSKITQAQAIKMGIADNPDEDCYGIAMYLMVGDERIELKSDNLKSVVRIDPTGEKHTPQMTADNIYQFVHDGWGGAGEYTMRYTLKDGRIIVAKIKVVSFDFK